MSDPADIQPKKRALIFAGGGVKVAFQAGVLQVWLDEAGLKFDLADGASGGTFNLAMYCQGLSGRRIADNWRDLDPLVGLDFNWSAYAKLFFADSIFEMENFRERVFPAWGLDWDKIRASEVDAVFNVYNFSKHRLELIPPARMSADYLTACVSLPMWFPPVRIDGDLYIDPVWVTDANLDAAIRRGADELWIIWTVGREDAWRDGFVNNYFQIIEACANGELRKDLDRIERNNADVAAGLPGCYGRRVDVQMLAHEVPVHYLLNLSRDRFAEAVNLGVTEARRWCAERGIAVTPLADDRPAPAPRARTTLSFTEEMKGFLTMGETDHDRGYRRGARDRQRFSVKLTIAVDDVDAFLADPLREAAAAGVARSDALGGEFPVGQGVFNLFVDQGDPSRKRMYYRLFFRDSEDREWTFSGFKEIRDDPGFDAWSDTTTLYSRLYRGRVGPDEEEPAAAAAAGIIRIHMTDFLKQLTTFRVEGPTHRERAAALARFGQSFLGKLWEVYAREVIPTSPI